MAEDPKRTKPLRIDKTTTDPSDRQSLPKSYFNPPPALSAPSPAAKADLSAEGLATATRLSCVGVRELKATANQGVAIVEHQAI